MRRFLLLILAAALWPASGAGQTSWHGYLQTRFGENYLDQRSFSIRRAKLWISGAAPLEHWYFKVQSLYRWQNSGALVLQDAFAEYRGTGFTLRFGQMVPQFSLQRSQPDYLIPLVERARVIDALIPAAETLARDIGVMAIVAPRGSGWHGSVGLFNGNGADRKGNEDRQFLVTARSTYAVHVGKHGLAQAGISLAYRKTAGIALKHIFGNDLSYSGVDSRWGLEAMLTTDAWQVQGEYLQARLSRGVTAWGYYLLVSRQIRKRHRLTLSLDKLHAPIVSQNENPWWIVGYGYYLKGQKNRIFLDLRFRKKDNGWDVRNVLELQLFFN